MISKVPRRKGCKCPDWLMPPSGKMHTNSPLLRASRAVTRADLVDLGACGMIGMAPMIWASPFAHPLLIKSADTINRTGRGEIATNNKPSSQET